MAMRSWVAASIAASVVMTTLQGCTTEDPALARDALLLRIETAVQEGDPDGMCGALAEAFLIVCSEEILPSDGLQTAAFQTQEISVGDELHIMTAENFELVLNSFLLPNDEGKEAWVFSVESFELPSYVLPWQGLVNGRSLEAKQRTLVMPSDEAPVVEFSSTPDSNVDIKLIPKPWKNELKFQAGWALGATDSLRNEATRKCEYEVAMVTMDDFRGGFFASDNFFQTRNPKFPKLDFENRVTTKFIDGSEFQSRWRTINNPSALTKGTCDVAITESTSDVMIAQWSADISFEGTIGEISGNAAFAQYTGVEIDQKFESEISGSLQLQVNRDTFKSTLSPIEERVLEIPLRAVGG